MADTPVLVPEYVPRDDEDVLLYRLEAADPIYEGDE